MEAFLKFKATKFGSMFVRTFMRSLWLVGMTLAAGLCLELLVQAARHGGTDLAAKYPELLTIFRAVSILTWFEVSLLWIRLAVSPKIDFQAIANKLMNTADSGSTQGIMVVYIVNHLVWLVRVLILMRLCEFI